MIINGNDYNIEWADNNNWKYWKKCIINISNWLIIIDNGNINWSENNNVMEN